MYLLFSNARKAVIFGLLFCLVTLNLPKALFHDHEHDRIHVDHDSESFLSADEAHCFVCDIDLLTYSVVGYQLMKFTPKTVVHGKEEVYFIEKSKHYDFHHLRGPPAFV